MNATELLDVPVSHVLAAGPAAAQIFLDHGMACLGCPFAPFETLAEVASIYRVDARSLAQALIEAGVAVPHAQRIEP